MNLDGQTLLLVEDNDDDVFIFRRAYRQAQLKNPLQVVQDGEEACDYLLGRERFSDRTKYPRPALVFLDLKLPYKSGLEVLQTIREDAELRTLCVVVLTSSAEDRDVARAHELAAQAYLVKPPPASALTEVMALLSSYLAGVPIAEIPRISGDKFETPPVAARVARKE